MCGLCGQLDVCGNEAEQMQPLYAADHISGMLRYLNCRFVALPNFLGFVVLLFLLFFTEASIFTLRLFTLFYINYSTVMNEMQLYWRKIRILPLLPNISENHN